VQHLTLASIKRHELFQIKFPGKRAPSSASRRVYISERLKSKLEEAKITDLRFAESKDKLGKVWKPHFPIIEFEK
jgi:hypothetical protein